MKSITIEDAAKIYKITAWIFLGIGVAYAIWAALIDMRIMDPIETRDMAVMLCTNIALSIALTAGIMLYGAVSLKEKAEAEKDHVDEFDGDVKIDDLN